MESIRLSLWGNLSVINRSKWEQRLNSLINQLVCIMYFQWTQLSHLVCGGEFDRFIFGYWFTWFDCKIVVNRTRASTPNLHRTHTRRRCKYAFFWCWLPSWKSISNVSDHLQAVAFHPNGNYIATGSADLTVRLWDVTSGKLLRVFIDCHLPVNCVSFSPDGKYLAAAGEESKIRIFDLAAGSQFTELKDHSATINSIIWSPNGTKMASCCADGSLRVYTINRIGQSSSWVNSFDDC